MVDWVLVLQPKTRKACILVIVGNAVDVVFFSCADFHVSLYKC